MDSRGWIGVHYDHKYGTFDYMLNCSWFFSHFYMELLYLFLETPRGTVKCQWIVEVLCILTFFKRCSNLQSSKNKWFFIFDVVTIMNKYRNIKMADFWLKSAFLAAFPTNSVGLKLTLKVIVLENLIQIIKCPILGVTMKLLIASRIHD